MKKLLVLLFPLLPACVLKQSVKTKNILPYFDKQGHRGCRGLMPENTIPAMLTAIDLGVTTLEMDVVISKDGQVIVSHDPFMNREIVTKPDGTFIAAKDAKQYVLYQMDYDEIKRFDVGLKPNEKFTEQKKSAVAKPLLSALIDSVEVRLQQRHTTVNYNIEIKSTPSGDNLYNPPPAAFVDLVLNVVSEKKILPRVTIQSFDFRVLKYLSKKAPDIKTAALIDAPNRKSVHYQLEQLGFVPTAYSPHFSLVTNSLIKQCHEKGMLVIPWTVNDLTRMRTLKGAGVDGIITDYPNLFEELD
ncbi:MAG TPA: glycerophosphodiester phosphodiesterase family protein [Segetibacter sp.]